MGSEGGGVDGVEDGERAEVEEVGDGAFELDVEGAVVDGSDRDGLVEVGDGLLPQPASVGGAVSTGTAGGLTSGARPAEIDRPVVGSPPLFPVVETSGATGSKTRN